MDFNGLRLEYALEGNLNYIAWKDLMEELLEDNGLKEFIDKDVPKLDVVDATNLDAWQNKVEKARRILLEGVRDRDKLPWERYIVCNVEDFDRSIPKQQRP